MAFNTKRLSCVGNLGNSFAPRVWTYKTEDTHAVCDTVGYFNEAAKVLKVSDLIDIVVVTNIDQVTEAISTYGRHIVNSNSAGVVDISDVTVGVVTDTD